MTADLATVIRLHIEPGLSILPARMASPDAARMLLAIGLQESRFLHRRQIGGPARGFWQFELGGVRGVYEHHASADHLANAKKVLRYEYSDAHSLYQYCEHNDALAVVMARLLLWRLPQPLPMAHEVDYAWNQYAVQAWRPGKPHRHTWAGFWAQACEAVAAHFPVEV